MIACPLCEALFTRYELALEYQYDFLAGALAAALHKHGLQPHTFRGLLNASMYFSVPLEAYQAWALYELSVPLSSQHP